MADMGQDAQELSGCPAWFLGPEEFWNSQGRETYKVKLNVQVVYFAGFQAAVASITVTATTTTKTNNL